jgi:hypothetical protein
MTICTPICAIDSDFLLRHDRFIPFRKLLCTVCWLYKNSA